jgi:hypothetical protein
MNEAAAEALRLLTGDGADLDVEFDEQIATMLSRGLMHNDDVLVFAINDRGGAKLATGASAAMTRMEWDRTQYECQA